MEKGECKRLSAIKSLDGGAKGYRQDVNEDTEPSLVKRKLSLNLHNVDTGWTCRRSET